MKDPICGMDVAEPPKISAEREGVAYGFCSERCKQTFLAGGGPKPHEPAPSKKGYFILAAALGSITAFGLWRGSMEDFMGAFLLVFGAFKLLDLNTFADAYSTYDLIARKSRLYALAYPFLQLALGAGYLTRFQPALVNGVTMTVMAVSAAGVAKALASKRKIRCACLGTKIQLPMTTISLLEDVLMAVMAGFMLLS